MPPLPEPDYKYGIIGIAVIVILRSFVSIPVFVIAVLILGICVTYKASIISNDRSKLGLFHGGVELRTDNDRIMFYIMGSCKYEISRTSLHTSLLSFKHGEFYVVFSSEEIENKTHDELMALIRSKKAFAFPEDLWMREHEPDFF